MIRRIHLDFETASAADLKKVGAVRYAMDPTTRILLACWCQEYGDGSFGPVNTWRCIDQSPPGELLDFVRRGVPVCAHNALFELAIWTYVADPRMGWGKLSHDQMECTMARAHIMSLPGSLDKVAELLQVEHRKNPAGRSLIHFFSEPRRVKKGEDVLAPTWNLPEDHPDKFNQFAEYCADDVRAECAVSKVLPEMSAGEREIYHLDLKINMRGFRFDTNLMRKAEGFLEEAKRRVDVELNEITGGAVPKATQVAKLKVWLAGRGIPVDSLGKNVIDDVMAHAKMFEDDAAMRAITLRRLGAKATSLSKYNTGLRCVGFDERARGLFTYHKASTGRWAGTLYQPHNLERVDPDRDGPLVENMLRILHESVSPENAVNWCELIGLTPMHAIGKCTRAMIAAPEGYELIGCDYSNVEGRGSAWIAGESWKIDAFRAYDAGIGPDLYKLAFGKSFGKLVELVTKSERQIGKIQELALGYQGAVGALMSMLLQNGTKPAALVESVKPVAEVYLWLATEAKYGRGGSTFGLDKDQWTSLRYVVDSWRNAHPRVVQSWWDVQDTIIDAVSNPGEMLSILGNRVRVYCAKNQSFLYVYLPSGRPLSYFRPRVKEVVKEFKDANGDTYERANRQVVVEGWDSRLNKWGDVYLYGGLEWENIVQGMCRDLLAGGLLRCEQAGYPVVLHVHDEGVNEVKCGTGSVEEVQHLMAILPVWAQGFPLTSKAWRDVRYVK